jgi:hypothetical protein
MFVNVKLFIALAFITTVWTLIGIQALAKPVSLWESCSVGKVDPYFYPGLVVTRPPVSADK